MEQVPSIAERFEQIAAQHPDMPAVRSAAQSFTYAELNRAANRIARAIVAGWGDGEQAVPVLFGKNALVVAAMFGALKAGKFYVPLDAGDPEDRIRLMLADAQARLLLTDGANLPRARAITAGGDCAVLDVETLDPALPVENLGLSIAPERTAYLLYTSGTTGTPKGITHTHYALGKAMRLRSTTGLTRAGERHAQLYSLSTTSAVVQIFSVLLNAATCCIYDLQAEGLDGLADWLRREQINCYKSTPTVFRHFVATLGGPAHIPALRSVELSGEPVLAHDVALFKRHFAPPCILRISYGLSETRAIARYEITHETAIAGARVPVGTATPYAEFAIWDEAGQPVPPGTLGEIVTRSDVLSPGYWRNPALTAERFLPDPDGGNRRLFKTGDLGVLRRDGLLEHHGRKDDQVKVRGHRVELPEVEGALLAIPGVSQVAVIPHTSAGSDTRLIAYLTTANRTRPPAASLRARLAQTLPDYMLPSDFVVLDALPLNSGGKVDRRALPVPLAAASVPPMPVTEREDALTTDMLAIWRRIFETPLGPDDDFFALGGHSLFAGRIVAEVERRFGVKLAPAVLVEAPTVSRLAAHIRARAAEPAPTLVALQPSGARPPLFFVPGADGEAIGYAKIARHLHPDQPLFGLSARGRDGKLPPHETVEEMARDYIAAMRAVQPRGPYHIVGACIGGMAALEIARQLRAEGEPVAALVLMDTKPDYTPREVRARNLILRRAAYHLGRASALRPLEAFGYLRRKLATAPVAVREQTAALAARRERGFAEAYLRVMRQYRPSRYDGRLTVLGNAEWRAEEPTLGWRAADARELDVRTVPGTHDTHLNQFLPETVAVLNAVLDESREREAVAA